MEIVLNVGGLTEFLLFGFVPGGDDVATVIGISTVAYLSEKDPAHIFLPAAEWHDAAYVAGSSAQKTMMRHQVDVEFFKKCIDIANHPDHHDNREALEKEAIELFLAVRDYGSSAWENEETND